MGAELVGWAGQICWWDISFEKRWAIGDIIE